MSKKYVQYFVFQGSGFEFVDAEEEHDMSDSKMQKLLKKLIKQHPEVFQKPKDVIPVIREDPENESESTIDENGIHIADCIMMNNGCDNIVSARVLKGWFDDSDSDEEAFILNDDGLFLNRQVRAYVEVTCDEEDIDEDEIANEIVGGITVRVNCGGHGWFSSSESGDTSVDVADEDDMKEIKKLIGKK